MLQHTLGTIGTIILAAGLTATSSAYAAGHNSGDAGAGEKVFKKCAACHDIGPAAKIKVGPPLTDIFGRKAGSFEGYKYGKDIVLAGDQGLVWNEEELFSYLEGPRKYLRTKLDNKKAKSKMPLKLKKAEDRANVIAYLKTFQTPSE